MGVVGHTPCYAYSAAYEAPYYECALCGTTFRTPEQQDKTNLPLQHYMAVMVLQKTWAVKMAERKFDHADAILKAIDYIRMTYGSRYDYCDGRGEYVPTTTYKYDSYDFYVNVHVDEITDYYVDKQILDIFSIIPGPYGTLCSVLSAFSDSIENGDNLWFPVAITLVLDRLIPILPITQNIKDLAKAIGIVSPAYSLYNPDKIYKHNYSVTVEIGDTEAITIFYGDYCFDDLNMIYINKEGLRESEGYANAIYLYNQMRYRSLTIGGGEYYIDLTTLQYKKFEGV